MSPSINVELTAPALRRALDLLEAGPHESLDDLVEALILDTETRGDNRDETAIGATASVAELPERPALPLADASIPDSPLMFLTNRFGPLKLATRVLAEMSLGGEWPVLTAFQSKAAEVARVVGKRLREEDVEAGRRGSARRWVAYPVGANETAALERFAFSFTLFGDEGAVNGSLAQLGLASLRQDRVALTENGWRLARAPSPTLDGGGHGTLSADEVTLLRERVLESRAESDAAREFLQAVRRGGGLQGRVDELLGTWHPDWTADRAAAERSAMLGRLGELGVLQVVGRGPTARIELLDSAEFEKQIERRGSDG